MRVVAIDPRGVYDHVEFDVDGSTTLEEISRMAVARMYGCKLTEVDPTHVAEMVRDVGIQLEL